MSYKEESHRTAEDPLGADMEVGAMLEIDALISSGQIPVRERLDDATVTEYARSMSRGDQFPSITVFKDADGHFLVADGWHRLLAAKQAGLTHIRANVRPGNRSAALKFAIGANAKHGLRMTNADKLQCVKLALSELDGLSDHAIAELCGVTHPFVGKVRAELETVTSHAGDLPAEAKSDDGQRKARIGRDGKSRKMPSHRAKRAKSEEAPMFPSASGNIDAGAGQSQEGMNPSQTTHPVEAGTSPAESTAPTDHFRTKRKTSESPEYLLVARGLELAYVASGNDEVLAAKIEALWIDVHARTKGTQTCSYGDPI